MVEGVSAVRSSLNSRFREGRLFLLIFALLFGVRTASSAASEGVPTPPGEGTGVVVSAEDLEDDEPAERPIPGTPDEGFTPHPHQNGTSLWFGSRVCSSAWTFLCREFWCLFPQAGNVHHRSGGAPVSKGGSHDS